jgi:hypothetical protein
MPIMTPNPALGVNSRLALGSSIPTTQMIDFLSETLGLRETFIDPQGMRGTDRGVLSAFAPGSNLKLGPVALG